MSELSRLADQYVAVLKRGLRTKKGTSLFTKLASINFPYKKVRSNSLRGLGISHRVETYSKMLQTTISPVLLVSVSLSSVTTVRNPVMSWLTVARG